MTDVTDVTTIIVAGGVGTRLEAGVPKAFVEVAGASLLRWAVSGLRAAGLHRFVVAVPVGWHDEARREVGEEPVLVEGGATRTASVARALAAVPAQAAVVAVHDAARAFVPAQVVQAAVAAVVQGHDVLAAAPGVPVADTLKRIVADEVVGTVSRHDLVAIQTPQVVRRHVLEAAHKWAVARGTTGTDDLALVEDLLARGDVTGRIVVTPGSSAAVKITHPRDLAIAELLARDRAHGNGGPG